MYFPGKLIFKQIKRFRQTLITLTVGLGLLAGRAAAWNAEGHMVVAQIAAQRLTPKAKGAVDRLLAVPVDPQSSLARTNTFITAACWADDVKSAKGTGLWHYIDIPVTLDGTTTHPMTAAMDVVRAINQALATLRDSQSSDAQKAEMLRYLIHFVGDIHQPLHCSTLFARNHPDGDRGGNQFPITAGNISNLHYLWDDGAGLLMDSVYRPLDAADTTKIQVLAQSFTSEFSTALIVGKSMAAMDWAQEGAQIAKTVVYAGIQENNAPTASYLAAGQACVRQRLAIAGYRLTQLLNNLFDPPAPASAQREVLQYSMLESDRSDGWDGSDGS